MPAPLWKGIEMADLKVRLNMHVLGCGRSGEVVAVPRQQGLRMIERGKASLAGGRGQIQHSPPAPVVWPPNSGVTATRPQLAEISKRTGVKVDWLEAAVKRIKSGDAVPAAAIIEAIASRASMRKEVLALAEAYVIHAEMAAQLGVQAAQGGQDAPEVAEDAQDDAGDEGDAQGDVGAPEGEE